MRLQPRHKAQRRPSHRKIRKTNPQPAKHRFWHDLGLMIAQLVDIPFAALPVEAKQVSAVAGGLLAAGGVALVIYTRVHHGMDRHKRVRRHGYARRTTK